MPLKALIFTRSYKDYLDFIGEYHLKGTECKCVQNVPDIQGYHKDTNPDLLLIFLENFWLTPGGAFRANTSRAFLGNSNELADFSQEFAGQIYHAGIAEVAARLIQLTYITRLGQLPEYLSHEHEAVREAALKIQEELNG